MTRSPEPRHIAIARSLLWTKERPGKLANPKIIAMYKAVGAAAVERDEVAWCAAFAGSCLEKAGIASTRKLNARSYLAWGSKVAVAKARPGDVAVFSRGQSAWQGHVAFVLGMGKGFVEVIGGNQGDAVTIRRYPLSRLIGIRRAKPATAAKMKAA